MNTLTSNNEKQTINEKISHEKLVFSKLFIELQIMIGIATFASMYIITPDIYPQNLFIPNFMLTLYAIESLFIPALVLDFLVKLYNIYQEENSVKALQKRYWVVRNLGFKYEKPGLFGKFLLLLPIFQLLLIFRIVFDNFRM